jgi:amino acid adenylation domain-containing protein/non-ribosomal peptide synthase protein (TIGR01720 family)
MSNIHQQIAELPAEKRELLARLLRQKGVQLERSVILPQPRDTAHFPLSFAQQRLWFLDQYAPGNPAYNLPSAVRLKGQLDIAALERSLSELVRRHESLRTSFRVINGQPVQVIAPELALTLQVTDLRDLPAAERQAEVRRLLIEEARTPFDLTQAPLVRARLLRLADDDHALVLVMHHIISDGWSNSIFIREAITLYQLLARGLAPQLPPLPIQYADYAVWQREWLSGEVHARQLNYWLDRLRDCPTVLELPTDKPRPATLTSRGATAQFVLSGELRRALTTLSQAHNATLFMTLLAAFQTLLARYSRQDSISVGTPIAGRTRPEVQNLIGFFVNTLVLNADLSGDPTFTELLARVRETALGAYAHQELPFEMLVEALQPARDASRTPLFQVMFSLEQVAAQAAHVSELRVEPLKIESGMAKFDLTLTLAESPDELTGQFEYNTALFEPETIRRMIGHFETLLTGIVANPEERVSRLPLMSAAERHRILVEWNDTAANFPPGRCLHQLIEAQVARTPDAVAVISGARQLSYRELDEQANRLAQRLRRHGVGPGRLVGVCLERSPELVVALCGILKAGGAYLPLDPQYPAERLAFMLEDAAAPVLLTQPELAARLPQEQAVLMLLDPDLRSLADESAEPMESGVTEDDPAYVIYTSGSTGQPKGAVIPHRAIVNHMQWMSEAFPLTAQDRVLQKTPFSFDASVWEFFAPLEAGAQLVLARPGGHQDPAYLISAIRAYEVTILQLVPSVLQLLVGEPGLEECRSLRRVFCGGEALPTALVRALAGRLEVEIINLYGPTEAAIDVTAHRCEPESERQMAPLGRPIANLQLYILDERQEPVPIGVPGELYIGGAGVARGYLNRPELTAEKFIEWSVGRTTDNRQRLYRTGDLARWLADGTVEYLGRADEQVKLRGLRIEPGEIEAALRAHAGVRAAAVVVRDQRLVAYCVAENGAAVEAGELREALRRKLPEYMTPSAIVWLDELPRLPNGKLNRRGLPEPEWGSGAEDDETSGPRTVVEELLGGIFAEVLGRERVGVNESFFELGGHSLLATQVSSRVRQTFGVELPLRELFELQTVSALAGRIAELRASSAELSAPRIEPAPRDEPLPLSFAQQRMWFLDQIEPGNVFYHIPSALRLTGPLNIAALERSLNELVRRHESLRTTFALTGDTPFQRIAPELKLELPLTDLSGLAEAEREAEAQRLAEAAAHTPFDLARGPLVRARLVRLSDEEHVLLLTLHHSIADGWSMSILTREAAALYQAFTKGTPAELPALPVQYADFARWQRDWLQGETLDRQISWWTEQLQGSPALLELPTDRPRPAVQTFNGAQLSFSLAPELAQKLAQLSRQENVTLFMTLLAAFQTLLHRYSGQDDILVGTPIAGRNRAEIEGLIGMFVNTLVLRTRFDGDPDFRELLRRVRETALGAYAHQELPFEKLVDAMQTERSLSYTPLFQVMFALQNLPPQTIQAGESGLSFSTLTTDSTTARFDLTLVMSESADGLGGALEYNTDLFDRATMERLLGNFRTLLESVVAVPEEKVARLPLLSEAERQQVLTEWNDTTRPFSLERCAHQLFEAQAAQTPEAIAVSAAGRQLSYGELNERASQLAHYLRRCGVGPEVKVGLCVERSPELIIGALGVLKAGGAYLPLDASWPPERLAFILDDAGPAVLLTQASLRAQISDLKSELRLLCLDTDWPLLAAESVENPASLVTAENLAYVIYTSGSTGQPKGTELTHRGLLNLVFWHQQAYEVTAADRATQIAAPGFDASVWEVWPYLAAGASLHIPDDETRLAPDELQQWLCANGITISFLPTPLAESLLALAWPPDCSLRHLLTGGDKLHHYPSPELPFRLWNNYGPTEYTVVTTYCPVPPGSESAAPPIGRPIANTRVFVLDRHLQPVPVGVAGELCVSGAGLARGYLNRPELTAEKFIEWSTDDGRRRTDHGLRLYRTGDLVRWRPDGQLEFVGRTDDQVKLRGFRIEPGEIEAVLHRHAAVREAVVIAREDSPGNKRLVAYVVGQETSPDPGDLKNFLKQQLPDYMIPAAFVALDSLPLNSSGKVNRRALPAPVIEAENLSTAMMPRTEVEQQLAEIWQQVLGVKQVGVNDNFFALGGDSILSIQVVARARQAGLSLTPKQLFAHPTLSELAAVTGQVAAIDAEQGLVTGAVPLTPVQRWFFAQQQPDPAHWNQAVMLTIRQPLTQSLFEATLTELLRHHDALRMRYEHTAAGWTQTNAGLSADDAAVAVWLDFSDRSAEQLRAGIEAAAEKLQSSLRLGGPLLRAAYFDCGPQRPGRLLLVIHHLVIDGVSWRVLLEDFQTAYAQLSQGQKVQLPPKTTSFKQWAERLEEYAQSEQARAELDYWLAATGGKPARLPVDEPEGINTEASSGHVTVALSEGETRSLLQEAPQAYRTEINDILLAALAQTLTRWTGEQSVLVDLEGHGREEIHGRTDVSRTVGWFTTLYPVRLEAAPHWNAGELLRQTRERLRRIPQRGIGYGLLRYLNRDEEVRLQLAAQPRAEVSFNYLGQFDQIVREEGLFGPAPESTGHSRSERGQRNWLLDVTGSIAGGQLRMSFGYSRQVHHRATIERVAADYLSSLRALLAHCLNPEAFSYAASDFELAGLDQKKLDKVLGRLSRGKKK